MGTGKYSITDAKPMGQYSLADAQAEPANANDPGFWKGVQETTLGQITGLHELQQKNVEEYGPFIATLKTGYDIAKGLLTVPEDQRQKIYDSVKKGDAMSFIQHIPSILGGIGVAPVRASELATEEGKTMEALGQMTGIVGSAYVGSKAPAIVKGGVKVGKTVTSEFLGKTTGVGSKAIREAIDNPSSELIGAMRGEISEMDVLNNFKESLQNVKQARSDAYQAQLSKIPMAGKGTSLDISPIQNSLKVQLQKFNIKVSSKGELDFSRSTIRDAAAQNDVKSIYNDVMDWGKKPGDRTPTGVDILKRRIDDTYSPSSTARAIVQTVKNATRDLLNTKVPGYAKMTKGYADASKFIDQLSDLSLESKNSGTAIRKLTTLLNQNNGYRQMLAEQLSQYTTKDLEGQLAGVNLSRWSPRGIMGPASGAGLVYQVASHSLNPYVAVGMAMTSPRLMGELLTTMAKLANKVPAIPVPMAGHAATTAAIAQPGLLAASQEASK